MQRFWGECCIFLLSLKTCRFVPLLISRIVIRGFILTNPQNYYTIKGETNEKRSGTGIKKSANKEIVDFKRVIGKYVDPKSGKAYDTTMGTIHYSKDGTHIVPSTPIDFGG